MSKGPARLFTPQQELEICAYYWTRLNTGYYPSYAETGQHFGCSGPLIKLILKRNNKPRRTHTETRGNRPCKPITRGAPPNETPPLCGCGCGQSVEWNTPNYRWFKYIRGHYSGMERKIVQPTFEGSGNKRPFAARRVTSPLTEILTFEILTDLYTNKLHTVAEIAKMFNVGAKSVSAVMRKHGIQPRTLSDSLILRGSTRGDKNPAWKGGIAEWNYSPDWKRICKEIKDRDEWTCQHCNERRARWGMHLHVHHIDGNKLNNHPDNLISLCAKCHRKAHGTK